MKYLILDASNLFFRSQSVAKRYDLDDRLSMSLHILFMMINKSQNIFKCDHVVCCDDGRKSFRYEIYEQYKSKRKLNNSELTEKDKIEKDKFREVYSEFINFIKEKTNITYLKDDECEADDFIARWIQCHSKDEHVILSSDSDFHQLINKNVQQFNGMVEEIITVDGIFDIKNNPVLDNKTKQQKTLGDITYKLFEKCIRGDATDSIFSAYPGARAKGTKKNIGIMDAYNDKIEKGFLWNSFMLHRWLDHNNVEHKVLEDYNRNVKLIDLTAQPDYIKEKMDKIIIESVSKDIIKESKISMNLLKFLGKYKLNKIIEQYKNWVTIFSYQYGNERI